MGVLCFCVFANCICTYAWIGCVYTWPEFHWYTLSAVTIKFMIFAWYWNGLLKFGIIRIYDNFTDWKPKCLLLIFVLFTKLFGQQTITNRKMNNKSFIGDETSLWACWSVGWSFSRSVCPSLFPKKVGSFSSLLLSKHLFQCT